MSETPRHPGQGWLFFAGTVLGLAGIMRINRRDLGAELQRSSTQTVRIGVAMASTLFTRRDQLKRRCSKMQVANTRTPPAEINLRFEGAPYGGAIT
jgi:hypothetical protein